MKALYFLPLVFLLVCASCKKNEAGGKAEIKGRIAHHSKAIGNATVYIKYDATEFPGKTVSAYDTYVKGDAQGNYSFKCYKGDYYLYAVGIDSLAVPTLVEGGVPVHVRSKEFVRADIAVAEEH
jgi:hypothetical protein